MAEYVVEFGKDGGCREADGRLDAPAFHRNHQVIGGVLDHYLAGKSGNAVEVGSGTGQHAVEFARRFPEITWWPSDFNDGHLASIEAWRTYSGLPNIRPPQPIDVSDPDWGDAMQGGPGRLLAVFSANVVHIVPWRVVEGLVSGAGRALGKGGTLFLYGPFKRGGEHTAPSNEAFDRSLRQRDPGWGVRDVEAVDVLAGRAGLSPAEVVDMPANNFTLVFRRR